MKELQVADVGVLAGITNEEVCLLQGTKQAYIK